MKSVSVRELQRHMGAVRQQLAAEHYVVLTARGRPFAILAAVEPDHVEEGLRAIASARALAAMRRMQASAKARGLDKMSMREIDALIAKVRRERRKGTGR